MSRTLAFAAVLPSAAVQLSADGFNRESLAPAVPLDPWSATAEQIALVLADIRSWDVDYGDDDTSDAALLGYYRGGVNLPGVHCPGALEFVPYGDEELDAAWIAMLTPAA